MIYAYVFDGKQYVFSDHICECGFGGGITCEDSFEQNNMGLLLVCHQVQEETALLPYRMGMFSVYPGWGGEDMDWGFVRRFLEERSQAQIKAMRSLYVNEVGERRQGHLNRTENGKWWFERLSCKRV
jgi:hypothetical protein